MEERSKKLSQVVIERVVIFIMAGLGFVAALAWNDAVQSVFQAVFPQRGSIAAKFIYAIFITVVITFISLRVSKYSESKNS